MSAKDRKTFSTHLYPKDIVQCTFPNILGVIQSCWWDDYGSTSPHPLEEGEFLVSFFVGRTISEIKSASELRMVDRSFRIGDICQRAGSDDPQPGTWERDFWLADHELPCQPDVGEYVTYDNWIGQVIEVSVASQSGGYHMARRSDRDIVSQDLLPQMNLDEHECWPGQYALWKVDDVANNVVVQSVNAAERTAIVFLVDNGAKELVSLLELDRSETDLSQRQWHNRLWHDGH